MKIKKDMMVKVVSGNFKGMTGKVLKVIPHSQRAIVEGIALTKRAVRPTQENPQGGFSERERSFIFLTWWLWKVMMLQELVLKFLMINLK